MPLLLPNLHRVAPGVYAYPLDEVEWQDTPRRGVREKVVRRDGESGDYLGVVAFDPLIQTGLHQHQGTAFAYFLQGSLRDYWGSSRVGTVGINLAGATHNAVTYEGCLLVSKLEGPVLIPPDGIRMHPTGESRQFVNDRPDAPPDIEVDPERVVATPTRFSGVSRRMLFDYSPTADDRRMSQMTLLPRCRTMRIRHSAVVDWFVVAGDLNLGQRSVSAPALVTIEPGTEIALSSEFGCSLLAWAEGPAFALDDDAHELYGFA